MKFTIKPTDWKKIEADVLTIYCSTKQFTQYTSFDKEFSSYVSEAANREGFKADEGQILVITPKGYISAFKLLFVGIGKHEETDLIKLQSLIAKSFRKVRDYRPAKVAVICANEWFTKLTVSEVTQAVVEAISLSLYQFTKYKSKPDEEVRTIEEIILSVPASKITAVEEGLNIGKVTSESTYFARDLVNEPSVVSTPTYLAIVAETIAKASDGKIKVKILEKEEISKLGMNAYLGVAKGSDEPPKFIILSYKPNRPKKKIVLIGKGVTFDTGGLSLKPSDHMETMKMDMAGAATVLAVFHSFVKYPVDHEVVGIVAACENMPSGKALKPGDIVKTMNGKTIEVLNTDAEGRLTLADAFSYATKYIKPDYIIDLATLTGACMVALGQEIAGLWGNNEELVLQLKKSALLAGERVWQMPLEKEYKELIKSGIADVKNIQTGRYGGAITAALFLEEFVDGYKWAHIDIAGPAFEEGDTALVPKGGAGFGVRLLLHFLKYF